MSWIVWSIFLWLLIAAGIIGWKYFKETEVDIPTRNGYGEKTVSIEKVLRKGAVILSAICLGLWFLTTVMAMINQIKAGHIGIVYQFGKIVGQIDEGLQFTPPWTTVHVESVQTTGKKFPKLECFSQETQDVFISATLNINVAAKDIQTLYREVGPQWYAILVEPRVQQNFKDETVRYKSVDIAPNREKIRETVRVRLAKELGVSSIRVTDLLLENIDFKPGFKTAIENKQIATQDALKEEQVVKIRKFQADQQIEGAKGNAESILIVAQKQAQANKVLNDSLTNQLIQYTMINKLSDKVNVMMVPPGMNFIMDKSMFTGEKKEK